MQGRKQRIGNRKEMSIGRIYKQMKWKEGRKG